MLEMSKRHPQFDLVAAYHDKLAKVYEGLEGFEVLVEENFYDSFYGGNDDLDYYSKEYAEIAEDNHIYSSVIIDGYKIHLHDGWYDEGCNGCCNDIRTIIDLAPKLVLFLKLETERMKVYNEFIGLGINLNPE